NVFEDSRLHDVYAGEHQRRFSRAAIDGHTSKTSYAPVLSFHDTKALAATVGQKYECRQRVHASMSFERGAEIDVGDDLAVDDDKGVVFEERARVVECAAGAEYLRLFYVMKLHAEPVASAQSSAH